MRRKRWIGAGILVLLVMVMLSLIIAPQSQQQQGSTYSRTPSGYGAWYAYMEQQNLPIQRWQRPPAALMEQSPLPAQEVVHRGVDNRETATINQEKWVQAEPSAPAILPSPVTLVQINSRAAWFGSANRDWVEQGNVLILVGVRTPVSQAPFQSVLPSSVGAIKLETSRRQPNRQSLKPLLEDQYGAVVWEEARGQGKIIRVVTPFFAANAYQNEPGNFEFLSQLATTPGHPIYIDEYLHGYRDDQDQSEVEASDGLLSYLAKTPILLLAIQAMVLLLLLIFGKNQRLGLPRSLPNTAVENSEAYIQALAAVLQKANCTEFVVETIGKAEQQQFQQALGLGTTLLEPQAVIDAWVQQTERPAAEIQQALTPTKPRRWSDAALRVWLSKLQNVRRQLE